MTIFSSGAHDGPTVNPRSTLLAELREAIAEASTPADRDDVVTFYAEELADGSEDVAEAAHAARVAARYDSVLLGNAPVEP